MITKNLIATIALLCICSVGYSAVTRNGNAIRMSADGDSVEFASTDAAIIKIELTPTTTNALYQLRMGSESGTIVWETTSTETRAVTDAGVVVTAVGGLAKITDEVTIKPVGTLYLNHTDTGGAASFTGVYLYTGRKDGNN